MFATTGYSKPFVFKRFKNPYNYAYWGYYGNSWDAIAFIPNQNVVLCGFTLYGTDRDSYEMRYKIYVDDQVVEEEDLIECSDWEEKYYKRIYLKGLYEIKAGSKLEVS